MTFATITSKQQDQLMMVIPSRDYGIEYRPCQVVLNNGAIIENVYIVEENSFYKVWGSISDSSKKFIPIEDVDEITDSPNRLPYNVANKIYEAGETGMGVLLI